MDDSCLVPFLLFGQSTPAIARAHHLSLALDVVILALLLLANGLFVALQVALVRLRRARIDEMVHRGVRGAGLVQRAKDRLDDFVGATRFGVALASLGLGMVAQGSIIGLIGPPLESYFHILVRPGSGLSFGISMVLVTALYLVLGDHVPRMLALGFPARTAVVGALPVGAFLAVGRPFIRMFSAVSRLILRLFGVKSEQLAQAGQVYSEEEIRALLAGRQQAGLAEEEENAMIERVFSFFDMVATQIMIPRTEMISLPRTATLKQVMEAVSREGHDRYPVYGENVDEIVGIVLMKDIVGAINGDSSAVEQPVTSITRPALCVPGSLPMSSLMTQMREHHTRLAIVLDEYGGTAGMVTLGDVLERIVGEVDEEAQEQEPEDILPLGEGNFSVSGLLLTEDIEAFFGSHIHDEHNDTIGGVVFSELGRKPELGDEVRLDGLLFEVEALDGHRIDRLRVHREPAGDASIDSAEP